MGVRIGIKGSSCPNQVRKEREFEGECWKGAVKGSKGKTRGWVPFETATPPPQEGSKGTPALGTWGR